MEHPSQTSQQVNRRKVAGIKVISALIEAGASQWDLAETLGTTQAMISKNYSGETVMGLPSLICLVLLADALRVDLPRDSFIEETMETWRSYKPTLGTRRTTDVSAT